MSSKAARPLFRSKVQKSNDTKAQDGTIKYHNEIVFESNATDQRGARLTSDAGTCRVQPAVS